jgi:hypothetical protein
MMRVFHRIGRRGASLLFLSLLDGVYAVSLLTIPHEARNNPAIVFPALLLPLPVWAAVWGSVGVVCLVQASREARLSVFAWITRYNTRRRHSSLGYLSPNDYEQQPAKVLIAA